MKNKKALEEARQKGWDKRDSLAKTRENDLIQQNLMDKKISDAERKELRTSHLKEKMALKEEYKKQIQAMQKDYDDKVKSLEEDLEKKVKRLEKLESDVNGRAQRLEGLIARLRDVALAISLNHKRSNQFITDFNFSIAKLGKCEQELDRNIKGLDNIEKEFMQEMSRAIT